MTRVEKAQSDLTAAEAKFSELRTALADAQAARPASTTRTTDLKRLQQLKSEQKADDMTADSRAGTAISLADVLFCVFTPLQAPVRRVGVGGGQIRRHRPGPAAADQQGNTGVQGGCEQMDR